MKTLKIRGCKQILLILVEFLICAGRVNPQAIVSGRILGKRFDGTNEKIPFTGVYVVQSAVDDNQEPHIFRTFETDPAGWFRISCLTGNHTFLFTHPASFIRPIIWNNVYLSPEDKITNYEPTPAFYFYCFDEKEWDPKPARGYYQIFTAKGKSITAVGFRFAHDGVDGGGPLKQNFIVSIHKVTDEVPQKWEKIGTDGYIADVDCGGAKNYTWYAGWDSGEIQVEPGKKYAVFIRPENPDNTFQSFWHSNNDDNNGCYRVGLDSTEFVKKTIWIALAGDGDGIVIPYNKKSHKQFGEFARFAKKWAQTYVARGNSLAGVVVYAAVGGSQPPLSRQRLLMRVRKGSPMGEVVGKGKIAVGNGNYTGDASWGIFGVAFAAGEVPLIPEQTYAIELESIESYETLHGYVNIKGDVSDERPGFNPYRKYPTDSYTAGRAFKNSTEPMNFNLDMQIIEYENAQPVDGIPCVDTNLINNGDMEIFSAQPSLTKTNRIVPPKGVAGYIVDENLLKPPPEGWQVMLLTPHTKIATVVDMPGGKNHFARIYGEPGEIIDGVLVQSVQNLSRFETYILTASVRSTHAVDAERQCMIGYDTSGQTTNVNSSSIIWTNVPPIHGMFVNITLGPFRPINNSVSVWLRGRASSKGESFAPFRADLDNIKVIQVDRFSYKR